MSRPNGYRRNYKRSEFVSVLDGEPKFDRDMDMWGAEVTIDGAVVQVLFQEESELPILEKFLAKLIKNCGPLKTKIAKDIV